MPSLIDRFLSSVGLQRAFNPFPPGVFESILGGGYYPQFSMPSSKVEPIGTGYQSLVTMAYAANPVVFACVNARVQLFSEARFQFQKMRDGRPGELFAGPSTYLRLLESPWPGGTTSQLLSEMLLDADFAGNAFVLRESNGYRRLRPDWVTVVGGSENANATSWDLDTRVLGYLYQPDGPNGGKDPIALQASEVAHFKHTNDPLRRWSGMPWLVPVIREIQSDQAGTHHKQMYWENAATPNLAIKFDQTMTLAQAKDWIALFKKDHEGSANAYKTLFLGGGADTTTVGDNMSKSAFTAVQAAGELRIASAAGVPPIVIGLAGGLEAATYSNYGQARRAFADLTMRPLWRDVAGALQNITQVPEDARLWFDDRDISFLQEDMKDAADIGQVQSQTMRTLIDAGFEAESVKTYIISGDHTLLKHSGLYSVQLQPPGTTAPTPEKPVAPEPPSEATDTGRAWVDVEVRCTSCNRMVAKRTAPGGGFEIKCRGCSALVTA